jgi:hypothetical protein
MLLLTESITPGTLVNNQLHGAEPFWSSPIILLSTPFSNISVYVPPLMSETEKKTKVSRRNGSKH